MVNNERTQQQLSKLNSSKSSHLGSPRKPASLRFLFELLKRWPWLVWLGVLAFLLAITTISIFSLTYTGRVHQKKLEPKPVAVENLDETSDHPSTHVPWLLGSVALTCAAGSLLIAKRLRASLPAKRQRVKSSSKQGLTRRQQRKRLLQESLLPTAVEPPSPVVSMPAETEPMVTVLPPEENHPLDVSKESLAEMMDIRKHRSLSSILDNSKGFTNSE